MEGRCEQRVVPVGPTDDVAAEVVVTGCAGVGEGSCGGGASLPNPEAL